MRPDVLLPQPKFRKGLAGCDTKLRLHQVNIGDLLGHGVLDLDSGVHLDEDMLASVGTFSLNQELNGSRILVANLGCECDCVPEELLAQIFFEVRCGGNLNNFLVAPLN